MDLAEFGKINEVKKLDRFCPNSSGNKNLTSGIIGSLFLTPTNLMFINADSKGDLWIFYPHILNVEKLPTTSSGTPLFIRCKNFLTVTFLIPKESNAHDIYIRLCKISQISSINGLYCFSYRGYEDNPDNSLGWDKFDLKKEYARMGLPNENWLISDINKNYHICDTYPPYLVVPSTANNRLLYESAKFRSKGRLPVLTYLHHNKAGICRCSQPLAGFSKQSIEDKNLLKAILDTNPSANCLYIVDTRPRINAIANRAAGKGYENQNFYDKIESFFYDIENIHVMRASITKLMSACESRILSVNAFLDALESSGWLKHIKCILDASYFIAESVNQGYTVVVHCSDGWDRTAQTCSIASLLLDPYYRTIDGFECLIEKDWLAFGHKFTSRCGHLPNGDGKEVGPIFTQFLECVWQISMQFPYEFEFNENFLLTIHDHVYSCQYGTFIGNCQKERETLNIKKNTFSLWGSLDSKRQEFINPLYYLAKQDNKLKSNLLELKTYPQLIRFWRTMYNRFDIGVHPRESTRELLSVTFEHLNSLNAHIKYLEDNIKVYEEKLNCRQSDNSPDSVISRLESNNETSEKENFIFGDSFDSVDSPLKIVQECVARLQYQQDLREREQMLEKNLSIEKSELSTDDNLTSIDGDKETKDAIFINGIIESMEYLTLNWQSYRVGKKCHACPYEFNETNPRYHCWSCGNIFCKRCRNKKILLPGLKWDNDNQDHAGQVVVCIQCFKSISSLDSSS